MAERGKFDRCGSCVFWRGEVADRMPGVQAGARKCESTRKGAARGWRQSTDWCACYVPKFKDKARTTFVKKTKARFEHG